MSRNIIFVGGIHGTGKSSVCIELVSRYHCSHISASRLIKWTETTKQVENVAENQRRLGRLLIENTQSDTSYVIDGHFALWSKMNDCEKVSIDTFCGVNLSAIVLITCDPLEIQQRISRRDGIVYDIKHIEQLQQVEIDQAKKTADFYHLPIYIIDNTNSYNLQPIYSSLDRIMKPYTRDNIYSEMLKTVIIRLDFAGATSIRSFVDKIKQSDLLESAFDSMVAMPKQHLSVSFRPKDIEDGGLPLTESQRSTLYRFKDCKLQSSGSATLDIDCESITIVIDCRADYKGSKIYTDFMSSLMTELFTHDKYITPVRLGIRKIDVQQLVDGEKIEDYFNERFTVAYNWNLAPSKKLATMTELLSIGNIEFNVTQRIDKSENGNDRLIYDVDSYIENGNLAALIGNGEVRNTMEEMQNHMFDLFVGVTSRSYLEKCKTAKEKHHG